MQEVQASREGQGVGEWAREPVRIEEVNRRYLGLLAAPLRSVP